MSQQANNNEKKPTEKCQCTKKIVVLEKEIKELKAEIERQKRKIDTIIKVLKRG